VAPELLLHALADGEPHSGEELARRFDVTRTAVWKSVPKLRGWGLDVIAVPGVGYRLARPVDLLDASALEARLPQRTRECVVALTLHREIDSTNRYLLERAPPPVGKMSVCLAEFQHAGRGRRGRRWLAPLGAGLCLSVGWQFADTPAGLAALALAVGVVARRVLERLCGVTIALKWPNDLVHDERKLGGILLEMRAEAQGGCYVVAGLGINVALPAELHATLSDWPRGAVDLATAAGADPPARTALAADLIHALAELFGDFAERGFAPYRADWRAADFLRGRRVQVDGPTGRVTGIALGIEADGALLIETVAGERCRVIAGDVSVRRA
jgi:BirA family transcriptional regulator, biotin operon repressor / biotin---[acetyl-CoA-carboxylase] ligase